MPNQITVESGQLTPTQQYEKLIGMGMSPSDASQYAGFTPFQTDTPSKDEMRLAVARNRAGQPVQGTPLETFTGAMQGLGNMLGSAAVGTGASILGTPGNIESLGRQAINYVSPDTVSPQTNMPTSEDILNKAKQVPILQDYADNVATKLGENVVGGILDPYTMVKGVKATKGMPVGMSIQDVSPKAFSPKDDFGFYSKLEKESQNLQRKQGNGQAFMNDLMKLGVKPHEFEATGMGEFLKNNNKLTKEDVQGFAERNRIQMKEVYPDEYKHPEQWRTPFNKDSGNNYREMLIQIPEKNITQGQLLDDMARRLGAKNFESLPMEQRHELAIIAKGTPFTESHFPENPNTMINMRMDDRKDVEGKKGTLLDELQSDWHQKGKERGYSDNARKQKIAQQIKDLGINKNIEDVNLLDLEKHGASKELEKDFHDNYLQKALQVPDAPYKNNWHELGLKKAIQHAVERGDDRLYLPTGDTLADRYDLSKQISNIKYKPLNDPLYKNNLDEPYFQVSAKDLHGNEVFQKQLAQSELSDHVGKDLAKKIIDNEGAPHPYLDDVKQFEGLDLKVGGEGMRKYYDEIYPSYLKKFAKQYGGRVGETEIETSPLVFSLVDENGDLVHYKEFETLRDAKRNIEGLKISGLIPKDTQIKEMKGKSKKVYYYEPSEEAKAKIKGGLPYKDGGVVKLADGGIVERANRELHEEKQYDGEPSTSPFSLVGGSEMPQNPNIPEGSRLPPPNMYMGHIGHNVNFDNNRLGLGATGISVDTPQGRINKIAGVDVGYEHPSGFYARINKPIGGMNPRVDIGYRKSFAEGGSVMETELAKMKEIIAKKKIEDELSGMAKRSEELRAFRPYESLTEVKPVTQEQVNAEYQVRQSKPTVGLRPTDVGGSKIPSTQLELFKKKGGVISFDEMRLALARKR